MSYKQLEDIQNIYEHISEPVDKQLVSEASAILIDTMFSEGYSEDAIAQFVLNSNPDDIVEKIAVAAENYIYIEASQLNESIDGVEYEILEENSQQVANLQELVEAALLARAVGALSKIAKPVAKGIAASGKEALKLGGKVAGKVKGGAKALVAGGANALKSTGKAIKKYGPTALKYGAIGGIGVPLAIGGAKLLKKGFDTAKKFVKGGTDAFKKPEVKPEPEVKKDDSLSWKNMKDSGLLDKKKEPAKPKVVPGSEKIIPARPANPSGKELPKPRTIGPDKGQINPNSARGQMIAKNKEIHGGKKIEKLRDKNAAFQAAKKSGSNYSMDDFVKDFPNSNAAKDRRKSKRVTSVMDMESYDAKGEVFDEGAAAALRLGGMVAPKIPSALKAIGAGAATGAAALKLKNVFKSTRVKGDAIPDKDDEFIR